MNFEAKHFSHSDLVRLAFSSSKASRVAEPDRNFHELCFTCDALQLEDLVDWETWIRHSSKTHSFSGSLAWCTRLLHIVDAATLRDFLRIWGPTLAFFRSLLCGALQ